MSEPAETPTDAADDCPRCRRLLQALRETRRQLRQSLQESRALREELLAAGEMMDDMAAELDKED